MTTGKKKAIKSSVTFWTRAELCSSRANRIKGRAKDQGKIKDQTALMIKQHFVRQACTANVHYTTGISHNAWGKLLAWRRSACFKGFSSYPLHKIKTKQFLGIVFLNKKFQPIYPSPMINIQNSFPVTWSRTPIKCDSTGFY